MIHTGLVSVTFRKLNPENIIDLAVKADLDSIEWGGDIHVPHGDIKRARMVASMMEDSGLVTAAYGSYYCTGYAAKKKIPFESVLETAVLLKAPTIRVWAGKTSPEDTGEKLWHTIAEDAANIAHMAEKYGITISFESHPGTLTETGKSTIKLIEMVNSKNIRTYWQPAVEANAEGRLECLRCVLDWLTNIHVFYWQGHTRFPFINGREEWTRYLGAANALSGSHYAMLEFVKDDSIEQFEMDAKVLKEIIASLEQEKENCILLT